jgi:hypothetical protein
MDLPYSDLEVLCENCDEVFDDEDFTFKLSKPSKDPRDFFIRKLIANKVLVSQDYFIFMDY